MEAELGVGQAHALERGRWAERRHGAGLGCRVEYGDERDPKMREFLQKIAPMTMVNNITKPMFVIQGKNDPRVPVFEAEQIVKTVRQSGKQVWYLLAKDEGHGFQKRTNRDFFMQATALFFEKHLRVGR